MGWRFRKSVKLLPGVRLNFGKRGLTSATIGKGWTLTNIGRKGVSQNYNIPGTGISYRTGGSGSPMSGIISLGVVGIVLLICVAVCCSLGKRNSSPRSAFNSRQNTEFTRLLPEPRRDDLRR